MKTLALSLAVALAACTNGQGEVDVTSTHTATFPGAPAAVAGLPIADADMTTEADVTVNVKSELDSLDGIGALSAVISENAVSGANLAVVEHITVTIATLDGHMPAATFADVAVPSGSTSIELPAMMSGTDVLGYLKEGQVVLHFTLTGKIPEQPITLTHTLVAHLNIAVASSLASL